MQLKRPNGGIATDNGIGAVVGHELTAEETNYKTNYETVLRNLYKYTFYADWAIASLHKGYSLESKY